MTMSSIMKLYLLQKGISYSRKTHRLAFTSQEIAAVEHIPQREFAKTVVLKADGRLIMAVLRGDQIINMEALKRRIGCNILSLVSEKEVKEQFPACQPGAMPPFGRLFGLMLYCDKALAKQAEIEFNAGSHTDTIRMKFFDFMRLECPLMVDFSEEFKGQRASRTA